MFGPVHHWPVLVSAPVTSAGWPAKLSEPCAIASEGQVPPQATPRFSLFFFQHEGPRELITSWVSGLSSLLAKRDTIFLRVFLFCQGLYHIVREAPALAGQVGGHRDMGQSLPIFPPFCSECPLGRPSTQCTKPPKATPRKVSISSHFPGEP